MNKVSTTIVDYAYPCMMAEKALRELHNAMLQNDHEAALEHALQAMVEVKLTYNSIQHMKDSK